MTEGRFDDIPDGAPITALSPAPGDPDIRVVRVADRVRLRLRSEDVEAIGLEVGRPWTRDLARTIEDALARRAAQQDALRMLGRRSLAVDDLRRRLAGKGHPASIVERTVNELAARGWLDDETLAQNVARETIRRAPAGERLIADRLRARRIDPALADRTARETVRGEDPVESALALARGRLRSMERLDPAARLRRVAAALARRGFDEDTVAAVLDRLGLRLEDDAPEGHPADGSS